MSDQPEDGDQTEVMRRRHAAVEAPPELVAEVVRRAAGRPPEGVVRVVRGYDSEVYRAAVPGGDLYVRIRRYGSVSYASESWAIESCRAAGAPVPEVLLLDTVELDGAPRDVMVQRAVPGRPLSELQGRLSRAELARVWAQAGDALARIHSVPAGGFYKMRTPGVWDFPHWQSVSQSSEDSRRSDVAELRAAGFPSADADDLLAMLAEAERAFPCHAPSLLHGDFLPGHLYVDEGLRLAGVIDFGDFQGGPRVGDLAILAMSEPEVDMRWLREGYGEQEPFDEHFERRLLLAGVEMQVGYLAHYLRQGNREEAGPIAAALQRTLARWRSARV